MATLSGILPAPVNRHAADVDPADLVGTRRPPVPSRASTAPPYGQRAGWVPRSQDDYDGGGAYPEVHVAQFPLSMGKPGGASSTALIIPGQLDSEGRVDYSVIAKYGHRDDEIVQAKPQHLMALKVSDDDLARPSEEEAAATAERTRAALNEVLGIKLASRASGNTVAARPSEPTYVKYTPAANGPGSNPNIQQRVIRVVETAVDPLEPPKFKTKKAPVGPGSPPVPVLHSPPRKLTVADMQNWKIPPCVSQWKNAKGYTIPLDKRLAADGRRLQEHVVSDGFAKLSEALYVAERKCREEIELRRKIQERLLVKEKEQHEEELRRLAEIARAERDAAVRTLRPDEMTEVEQRELIRDERARERERERRMEAAGKKTKLARDRDRDVSEKLALGQAPSGARPAELMYDQRLFNQTAGLASGTGAEDTYNVYDKPLFTGSAANAMYRPRQGDAETYGGEDVESVLKTARFKADKGFAGTESVQPQQPRAAPVEFEKDAGDDPFGVQSFLAEAKRNAQQQDGRKRKADER